VSPEASSDKVFATINYWIEECGYHCFCSRGLQCWLPTRVIDVGSEEDGQPPKLHEPEEKQGRYITLSHQWNLVTTSSSTTFTNYNERKEEIDVSTLPLTFLDAIEVTRKLVFRYQWTDALCIIQDSEEDWSREASNMISIFECACLNIAAAGSDKDDGRLFMKRESL